MQRMTYGGLTICGLAIVVACLMLTPVFAQSQSFGATATLPAGGYRAVGLTGVPEGSRIEIDVRTEAQLSVLLITETNADRFPEIVRSVASVFASGDRRLTVRAPEAGRYLVILDNREGVSSEDVAIAVTVSVD